jgi:photosystem II stability/assembly factor-like uncharacterized protein
VYNFANCQPIQLNDEFWFQKGPHCAWVESLAMAESNPEVLYLGSFSGVIYKTNDGGQNWYQCDTTDLPVYPDHDSNGPVHPSWTFGNYHPTSAIAIDPTDEDHVWIGFRQNGLMESTNGGDSWQRAHESLPIELSIKFIDICPDNPNDILLGAGFGNYDLDFPEYGGLYRTTNGGQNWQLIEDIPHGGSYLISTIKRDTLNPGHVIIGYSSNGEPGLSFGLMESFDNGETWQELSTNIYSFYDLEIDPVTNTYWSVTYTEYMDWLLQYSTDLGQTWQLLESFDDPYIWITSFYTDADFNMYIARPDMEASYSAKTIYKSTNNGATWTPVNNLEKIRLKVNDISLRNTTVSQNDNTDNIYFGNFYGVFHSEDGGQTTHESNVGLNNAYIESIEVNPKNPDIIYADGSQGLWCSKDGGGNWSRLMGVNDVVFFVRFDNKQSDTLFLGGEVLWRSYDGGETFEDIKHNIVGEVLDLAQHPDSANILLLHSAPDIYSHIYYKSSDGGDSWEETYYSNYSEGNFPILFNIQNPDTVYCGRNLSSDGGETWQWNYFGSGSFIQTLHPTISNKIYSRTDGMIYMSTNSGTTFSLLSETTFVQNSLIFAENNPDYMFLCHSRDKVEYSIDEGATWITLPGNYGFRTRKVFL